MEDVITESYAEIERFTEVANKTLMGYAKLLWSNALKCDLIYHENVLKGIFIEVLPKSFGQSLRAFPTSKKNATGHDRVRNAASLTNLQHGFRLMDVPSSIEQQLSRLDNRKNQEEEPLGG